MRVGLGKTQNLRQTEAQEKYGGDMGKHVSKKKKTKSLSLGQLTKLVNIYQLENKWPTSVWCSIALSIVNYPALLKLHVNVADY